jgi:phage-related protein
MAEKVIVKSATSDLDGSQLDNAATEATLLRLVNLFEKSKTGSGSSVSSLAERSKGIDPKSIKATDEGLIGIGRTSKDASSNVDKLSKSSDDASKKSSAFGSIVSLLASGPLALLGSAFGMITDTIGQSIDALRQTGSVGASFNGSLLELNKAAASAGMGLEEYAGFVKNNSKLMANFGGTATEGAKRMGELSKNLRQSDIGQQMQALGISTSDMNSALADYMAIEAQRGKLSGKTNAELTKGAGEYLKNLGDLSRLTGQSVDELSKGIEAQQRDAKLASITARMGDEEQKAFAMQMAKLNAISPKLADAFKDGMVGLGDNPVWNQLKGISPEVGKLADDMKNGRISQTQFADAIGKLGPELEARLADMSVEGENATEEFSQMRLMLQELNKSQKNAAAQAAYLATEEGKNSTAFTKSLMTAKDNLNAFWGGIKTAFLESGIFKRITGVVDWAAQKFADLREPMMRFVKTILDQVLPILDKAGEVLTDVVNSIMNFVAPYIPIVGKLFSDIADTIRANIKPAMEILDTVVNNVGRVFKEVLIPVIKEVWSDMKDLGTGLYDLGKSVWDKLMPAFDSVSDSFSSFLPSMDEVIQTAKDFKPVIVGVIEGMILLKGIQLAAAGIMALWNLAAGAGALAMSIFTSPVLLVVGAVVALGLAFKSLYDSGWTFNSALEAMGDGLKRAGLNISKSFADMIDYLKSFYGGGRTDAEKKKDKDIYDAEIQSLNDKAKARDDKRAEVRRDRGTEDSKLNFSGAGAAGPPTPGSPAAKKQEDALNDAKKKAEEVAVKTAALAAPKAPEATAAPPSPKDYDKVAQEARKKELGEGYHTEDEKIKADKAAQQAVSDAKAADAKEARERQVATLNTVSEQLYTLNEVMKEILKLNKDQAEAQKDLVNVTKGRYSPV